MMKTRQIVRKIMCFTCIPAHKLFQCGHWIGSQRTAGTKPGAERPGASLRVISGCQRTRGSSATSASNLLCVGDAGPNVFTSSESFPFRQRIFLPLSN